MTVVTFTDYQPLARHDNRPWTLINIYEGTSPDSTPDLIETIPMIPVDADPANPMVRSFTTELATLDSGWYKVTFEDATGDTSETEPIHNVADPTAAYQPLVSDVAKLMRARTKDTLGHEVGTFNASTRPTYDDVLPLIAMSSRFVTTSIDTNIPESAYPNASAVIALRTAMQIELSYWPEQINTPRSPYQMLSDMYKDEYALLTDLVERERGQDEGGTDEMITALEPSWSFAPSVDELVGYRSEW